MFVKFHFWFMDDDNNNNNDYDTGDDAGGMTIVLQT